MKILSWNVNGIRAIAKKGFLDWFEKEDFDILCLQETKALPGQLSSSLKNPDGYLSLWNYPKYIKGYSGVSVYTKIKPEKVETYLGVPEYDDEGRTLILYFDNFVLLNVYFPNGQKNEDRLIYKLNFYDAFLDFCNKLKKEGKNLIMCGDYNTAHKEIDLARPKENEKVSGFLPIERKWLDKYVNNGYIDTFRIFTKEPGHYTWWDYKTKARERNIGWRIDYFFVNEEFKNSIKNSYILKDVYGSDHCPIVLEVD
ncbi:MAG: exodeoxyribonuclease III [Spirochaetes bacterium]|nr:exodeoxyribonuclease III [Spirochaetota bacterium]